MITFDAEKFHADIRKASEELEKTHRKVLEDMALFDFGKILKRYGKGRA